MNKLLVIAHREDEKPIAIEKSLQLAEKYNAEIHIMAFCYEEFESIGGFAAKQLEQVKQQIIDKRHQWLQELVSNIDADGLKITFDVQWQKDIYKSVLAEIESNTYQLIVTQRHRTESFFHVPTEWYLLRESQIPVYLAHEDRWISKANVVAAVDLKNTSAEGILMRQQVLKSAKEFADTLGATLHCVFSFELPEVLIDLDVIDKEDYQKDVHDKYYPNLISIAKDYGISEECVHVKFGSPERSVASVATKAKAHTVVIGSLARKGLTGKLVGNTAEKLAEYLHTDMLIIAPQ